MYLYQQLTEQVLSLTLIGENICAGCILEQKF